jgi:hypothetical protein
MNFFRYTIVVIFSLVSISSAFNGHIVTEGPLKIIIGDVQSPTEYEKPVPIPVTVQNLGDTALAVQLRVADLVDEWYAIGPTQKQLNVQPGKKQTATFQIAAGQGAFSALYPVHIYATTKYKRKTLNAHAVQIFESKFQKTTSSTEQPSKELPANIVPAQGVLPLTSLKIHRIAWSYYDKPLHYLPIGWQGSDPQSSASFNLQNTTRGATKYSIHMHPPWQGGGGTIFAEYKLKLPNTTPITLSFANAIRDHTASEPPSDGVTFRVWTDKQKLFERHTDCKTWVPGRVDLSAFANKEILLRLESHPGPKRNTTCDSSFWAEPVITAGNPPLQLTPTQRETLRQRARSLVQNPNQTARIEHSFKLDDGYTALLIPGPNGVFDGVLAFGKDTRCVTFDGLNVSLLGQKIGQGPSPVIVRRVRTTKSNTSGKIQITHRLTFKGDEFDVTATIWKEQSGLRIQLDCPKRITDFSLAPADQKAPRVYYGHGYCIEEPQAFRAGFGGHNLSTSHVGFDFEKGISLLVATDHPPDHLEVNPNQNRYALHTHLNATMTFVPSTKGAFDCAFKYRPLYDKQAAPDFADKAGRFVFDIWGGRYAENAEVMKRMIAYGLTDSLLTLHVWQRWGYDYRLPDIYPPNPDLGTVEDMQKVGRICDKYKIPWGLHDNYIDIYPDAEDYSYNHICFTEGGQPVKAWFNRGRNAQSYRWRPDHIMPFVQRNLKLIKADLNLTHYFIDVFTSIDIFDFYDRHGQYHSFLETRKHWGESFAWIRDYLGNNAVMTSEAGHDQLVGYLAGADCQHLQITPDSRSFCLRIPCKNWQRVPWFDAVLHDKFSLHGVGYSSRYQGGRDRLNHGITSDDYISAEILEGHALMIDRRAFERKQAGRDAVRKYYLAQDFIRSIAHDTIQNVQFVDDDIHRQIITWNSGAKVYVNRGENDWCVAEKILPQFGYYAKNGAIESSIERENGKSRVAAPSESASLRLAKDHSGVIIEKSLAPNRWYFNARGYSTDAALQVQPMAQKVEHLGDNRFKLLIDWNVNQPIPQDLSVFLHFTSEKSDRSDKIAFQGDFKPNPPTGSWQGKITTGSKRTLYVNPDFGAGEYEIKIGLWDSAAGRRYPLLGDDDGSRGYRLGKLIVRKTGDQISNIALVKNPYRPHLPNRWNLKRKSIDFGPTLTTGAFRLQKKANQLIVTPLPKLPPFEITMRLHNLLSKPDSIPFVTAVDIQGNPIRHVECQYHRQLLIFKTKTNEFAYHIKHQ